MSLIPAGLPADFNATLLNNTDLCTLKTCPLILANTNYVPTLGGNVLFAAIFGLALVAQIYFTIKYKTLGIWSCYAWRAVSLPYRQTTVPILTSLFISLRRQ